MDAKTLPISVIVTCRNDPLTIRTVTRALATADNRDRLAITVVEDHCALHAAGCYPQGVRQAQTTSSYGVDAGRHVGLSVAPHDTCLLLDAHMDFQAGWDTAIAAHWITLPRPAIACCRMPPLYAPGEIAATQPQPAIVDGYGTVPGDQGYGGARIQLTMDDASYGGRTILQPKWLNFSRKETMRGAPLKIGCVLGAAYVLSRDDYHNRLAGCLQHLVSWGWSEQWLSLVNWCMGGDAYLLPVFVAHRYQTSQPFPVDRRELRNNQAKCLALPWPADVLTALATHASLTPIDTSAAAHVRANATRTLADYIAQWVTPYSQGAGQ